ncbi:MAG: alcohol dehydrogenase catalytic domain-containing protein [Deltaproteobacteria bacterium]|nr:MAG: alcohol dehydrogenase catalytic domain-containing protein [Deltaproteobacteria bacterium]
MKMKAALYYAPGDIRIEEVPYPKCTPEGAVVKVSACGVCTVMDVDAWIRWQREGKGVGMARGHEWSGEIVEIGSKVTDFKVGDRIFQNPVFRPCYRCQYCFERDYWRCINWTEGLAQRAIHGGFAEYIWIPFITNESAAKMPNELSWNDLAMIEPLYLAVGLARKARPGEVALVIGQELMGLATVAKLKERNVKIIAGDVSKKRLEAAGEVGADVLIDSINEDVVSVVMKETKGKGADVVIIIDTRPAALMQAISSVRRAGTIWLAGFYYSPFKVRADVGPSEGGMTSWIGPGTGYTDPSVGFDPALLHMQVAWGSLGPRVPRWLEAAELIQSGKITAEKHVTSAFPLDKTKEAFDLTTNDHDQIKVMVEM